MKLHQLIHHEQLVAHQHQHQRELSAASKAQQQANNLTALSEDEDDDYADTRGYLDLIERQQQQQQANNLRQASEQSGMDANSEGNSVHDSSYLVDKNKKLFPQKLWELIHNPSIQHCLRWSADGQRVYLNRNEFEVYYLKTANNQFHTQKAISFVRQMNMYGFRKVDDCYYENDNFRRDRKQLLKNMIRRHPNKGLFAGLDHHQLAAAAAAQQALQVNQQLVQLEQQHKQRTEQALRLSSYLNGHQHPQHQHQHQQHQQHQHQQHIQQQQHYHAAALAHTQHQLHAHSLPFEQMSSQLAQAAANQLNQQQHQFASLAGVNGGAVNALALGGDRSGELTAGEHSAPLPAQLQAKKSRLLADFYAANGQSAVGQAEPNGLLHSQDSMQSSSSADSRCSSAPNSGSAGSPQPNASSLHQRLAMLAARKQPNAPNSLRSAAGDSPLKSLAAKLASAVAGGAALADQSSATDLSSHSLAARQSLHETLVRSLLQLRQQQQQPHQPQALLAGLSEHNSRGLLESLASLSSASSGSVVDPTSNSPTERTTTPPSSAPSPNALARQFPPAVQYASGNSNNIALDLAKSKQLARADQEGDDTELEEEEELNASANSPLDGARKVRRFLDNQMAQTSGEQPQTGAAKRERSSSDDQLDVGSPASKRSRLPEQQTNASETAKSLIVELCERRGDKLAAGALDEAAQYAQTFLTVLLDDAALIARHSTAFTELAGDCHPDELKHKFKDESQRFIDSSSLSLALKLIPNKLLTALQQQVTPSAQPTGDASDL